MKKTLWLALLVAACDPDSKSKDKMGGIFVDTTYYPCNMGDVPAGNGYVTAKNGLTKTILVFRDSAFKAAFISEHGDNVESMQSLYGHFALEGDSIDLAYQENGEGEERHHRYRYWIENKKLDLEWEVDLPCLFRKFKQPFRKSSVPEG